nr:hypothetical protein [Tanacetum cinerariifolium]
MDGMDKEELRIGIVFCTKVCRERRSFKKSLFIIKDDKDAIPEFSTIVSSEFFDIDVILIFNSFDEGHDSFRQVKEDQQQDFVLPVC